MMIQSVMKKAKNKPFMFILFQASYLMFFSYIISFLVSFPWGKSPEIFHSLMELFCIIIAASSFIVVWCRYNSNSIRNQVAALGFLSIAIFDILHTYYWGNFGVLPFDYPDLATRFWIISRLTEAVILLVITADISRLKINKWLGLFVCFVYTSGISYLIFFKRSIFPVLYNSQGVTHSKIIAEYFIISILIFALWNIKKKIDKKDTYTYKYIALTIILFIFAELCFTLYVSLTNFVMTYGHVLKILYYISLYEGIIKSEINYPYMELEQANRQFEETLDTIPIGIITYNKDLKVSFANKKLEELLHCRKNEILGLTSDEVARSFSIIGEKNESIVSKMAMNKEESIDVIKSYKTCDGANVKLHISVCKTGTGFLFMCNDVKHEQQVASLNIQTKTILNAVSVPMVILSNDGCIVESNSICENLIAMKQSDIIGKNIFELGETIGFIRKDISSDSKISHRELSKEDFEASLSLKNGENRDVLVHVSSISNIENERIGSIVVIEDLTDIKRNQEKLVQQEKLAMLGQMGASIVHETRNFLTTIKGSSQLIELISGNEKIKGYAKKINTSIDEVNRIISEFLSLSKPTSTSMQEISIHDLLLSMKSTIETSSLIKGINIDFSLSDDERYILCDESKIKQVILNICKNAVEAMNGVKNAILKIESGMDEENNEIYIKIKDNGSGIPKDILPKIGTPFFTTKKNGTGLGINACFQIIKEHKGRISIESKAGIGTTFNVFLPCIEDDYFEDECDAGNLECNISF